jgi:alanine transaminase
MTNPPRPGEPSHMTYEQEREATLDRLSRNAEITATELSSLPNFDCNAVDSGLFVFPEIRLSKEIESIA